MRKKETIKSVDDAIRDSIEAGIIHKRGTIKLLPLAKDIDDAKKLLLSVVSKVDVTIKNLKWQPEYNELCRWMANPERGLLLTGNFGRLKTVFATLVLPVLYMQKYSYRIRPIKAWEIASNLSNPNNCLSHPVVIVDDVGEEPTASEFGTKYEPFSRLVDECEKKSLLLIITTNLNSQQLTDRYGARPVDRIDILCDPIVFKGKSFR